MFLKGGEKMSQTYSVSGVILNEESLLNSLKKEIASLNVVTVDSSLVDSDYGLQFSGGGGSRLRTMLPTN